MADPNTPYDMSAERREMHEKAAAEAAHFDAARTEAAAGREAAMRDIEENEALRARIAAQQAEAAASVAAAERKVVDNEVAIERERASNFTFGFALTAGVLGAALLVGLLYMLTRPTDRDQVVVNAGTLPTGRQVVVTQPPAAAPPTVVTVPGSGTVVQGAPTTRPAGTPMQRVVVTPRAPYATVFTASPDSLVNKRITFDIVRVDDVIADRAFWIGSSTGERMLAVLGPGLDEGIIERIVKVKPGQLRTMSGTVQDMPPIDQAKIGWKLDEGDVYDIMGQTHYLLVDRIDMK